MTCAEYRYHLPHREPVGHGGMWLGREGGCTVVLTGESGPGIHKNVCDRQTCQRAAADVEPNFFQEHGSSDRENQNWADGDLIPGRNAVGRSFGERLPRQM
jgi:hypothetical protein